MRRLFIALLTVCLAHCAPAQPVTIRMIAGPSQGIPPKEATDPRSLARRAVFEEFHRQNPDVEVVNAGGLELVGDNAESMFLMAMAGDTAPDVFYVNFRQYYNYIDQGFCRPLDDLIRKDPTSLQRMNPDIEKVIRSYDGQLYAVPWFQVAMALYYRKDLFADAGLDPSQPPRTWDQFLDYGRKITESKPGCSGFAFSNGAGSRAYFWVNFVWQAGGEVVRPAENGYWKSDVDSPGCAAALDFYRRMVAEKWQSGSKTMGPMASITPNLGQDILDGKVGMWFSYTNDVVLNMTDLNPSLIGIAAMPEGPAGSKNEINAGMWAINARVKDPRKLDACWRFIKYFAGDEAARINTERFIDQGLGNLVNPSWLEKFGHHEVLASIDPGFVKANQEVFQHGHPEPYGRNCQQAYVVLDQALDRAVLEPDRPSRDILKSVAAEMDQKLLGYTPPEKLAKQRGWALGFLAAFLVAIAGVVVVSAGRLRRLQLVKERLPAGTNRRSLTVFMSVCLGPAVLSILVWSYYPLLKGLVMAFQDYRIMARTRWIGLDNFIAVFTSPVFYKSILNSFLFVGLTILIGFALPILLALALNEIPRFKVLFRTLFYLPAMTSGIVITFLWRLFYDKSEQGLLNSILLAPIEAINPLLKALGLGTFERTHDWLGDPHLAMFAVVLPGVWAAAGPGSILYLAALKNIPGERFEAAEIDGANEFRKIVNIVLPALKPLVLINLLGVFVGGFKAMENVFVLTSGGPLYATHTMGLEVWTNAFMFLKFGYATAAAWVMGAILVGFTLLQVRYLLSLRFQASGTT